MAFGVDVGIRSCLSDFLVKVAELSVAAQPIGICGWMLVS